MPRHALTQATSPQQFYRGSVGSEGAPTAIYLCRYSGLSCYGMSGLSRIDSRSAVVGRSSGRAGRYVPRYRSFGYVCLAIAELGHHPNGVPPALVRVVFLTWVPALGVARGLAFAVSLKCQWLGSLMLGHHVVRLGPAAG